MKVLKYRIMTEVNHGTEEQPDIQQIFSGVSLGWSEANEELAKREAYNGEYTIEEEPEPPMTAEEVRAKRDRLLAETDWTQVLDAPISTKCREEFRVYHQELRDVTEQEGFPTNIVWPEMPVIVKATPEPIDEVVEAIIGVEVTE